MDGGTQRGAQVGGAEGQVAQAVVTCKGQHLLQARHRLQGQQVTGQDSTELARTLTSHGRIEC